MHRTNNLRIQIQGFAQKEGETFDKTWEHFKDLLNACVHTTTSTNRD